MYIHLQVAWLTCTGWVPMHTIALPESWVLDTFWRESEAVPECPDTCTRIPVPGIWVCMYSDTGTGVPVYPGTGYVAFFIATMLDLCIQLYRVLPESWVLDTFGRESDVCPGTAYPGTRIPVCTSFLYDRGTLLTRKVPVDSTTICIIIPGTLVPTYNFFFATCIIAYARYYAVHWCLSVQTQVVQAIEQYKIKYPSS